MSDLLMEGSHTLISLAIGGLAGYCVCDGPQGRA